jgi:hypothetical protein
MIQERNIYFGARCIKNLQKILIAIYFSQLSRAILNRRVIFFNEAVFANLVRSFGRLLTLTLPERTEHKEHSVYLIVVNNYILASNVFKPFQHHQSQSEQFSTHDDS